MADGSTTIIERLNTGGPVRVMLTNGSTLAGHITGTPIDGHVTITTNDGPAIIAISAIMAVHG